MDVDKSPEEYLCTKLINTYNTTILDEMDLDMQEALKEQANNCAHTNKQEGKERTVLKELIRRHYDPELQSKRQKLLPHYIGGPFNLTCHWSELYQKLIYIFGEEHSSDTDCVKFPENKGKNEEETGRTLIENFLKELIDSTDCFLDVLIEFEAYEGDKYKNPPLSENEDSHRLVKIVKTFSSCINASERDEEENKPKCSFSRIHYFDVRSIERDPEQTENGPDDVSHFILEYINITNGYITSEYYIGDLTTYESYVLANKLIVMTEKEKYKKVMEGFLLKPGEKKYIEFWHGMLSNNHYTKKELDHLKKDLDHLRDKDGRSFETIIESFIKDEILLELQANQEDEKGKCKPRIDLINILAQSVMDNTKIAQRLRLLDNNVNVKLIDDLLSLVSLIILVNASVIDAYLLARIFKKFDLNSEKPEKRRSTDEPDEAHNIIIYAGNKHCTTYRKFLKDNGFKLLADIGDAEELGNAVLKDKEIPNNCVNMKSKDKQNLMPFKEWSMQPLFSKWPPDEDPNLGIKDNKKSWISWIMRSLGCNVMFRSNNLHIKHGRRNPNKRYGGSDDDSDGDISDDYISDSNKQRVFKKYKRIIS